MRWVHRVVGNRFGPTRLIPVGILACVVAAGPLFGSSQNWVFVLAAVIVAAAGGGWPLAVALGQAAILVAASQVSQSGLGLLSTMASAALLELAIRRPLRQSAAGAAALVTSYFVVFYTTALHYGYGLSVAAAKAAGNIVGGYVFGGGARGAGG